MVFPPAESLHGEYSNAMILNRAIASAIIRTRALSVSDSHASFIYQCGNISITRV